MRVFFAATVKTSPSTRGIMTEMNKINRVLLNVSLVLCLSLVVVGIIRVVDDFLYVRRSDFESRFFPVVVDVTARNWNDLGGRWRAEVWVRKVRACTYLAEQVPTAVALNPDGSVVETRLSFVGDDTPGSSRPLGWQRLNRWVEFHSERVQPGATVYGTFLHKCHEGHPTTTPWGPLTVGLDSPWPEDVPPPQRAQNGGSR